MYRIAIVEDEPDHRKQLETFLKRFGNERELAFRLTCFSDAVSFLERYQKGYDLLFFDIRMPGIDGMQAAKRLREIDPDVGLIFVTSLMQYAVDGYAVNACDYIVKPIRYETFVMKLTHALSLIPQENHPIAFRFGTSQFRLTQDRIRWLESEGHNVIYHLKTEEIRRRIALNDAQKELDDRFLRISSGLLVNMDAVRGMGNGMVQIADSFLPVSQVRTAEVRQKLYDYRGWES